MWLNLKECVILDRNFLCLVDNREATHVILSAVYNGEDGSTYGGGLIDPAVQRYKRSSALTIGAFELTPPPTLATHTFFAFR